MKDAITGCAGNAVFEKLAKRELAKACFSCQRYNPPGLDESDDPAFCDDSGSAALHLVCENWELKHDMDLTDIAKSLEEK